MVGYTETEDNCVRCSHFTSLKTRKLFVARYQNLLKKNNCGQTDSNPGPPKTVTEVQETWFMFKLMCWHDVSDKVFIAESALIALKS